jgi:hypothetical protein
LPGAWNTLSAQAPERQADALCRKEYELQERVPWTKELRRVVEAMNRMTCKVKEMFEEQVTQAKDSGNAPNTIR